MELHRTREGGQAALHTLLHQLQHAVPQLLLTSADEVCEALSATPSSSSRRGACCGDDDDDDDDYLEGLCRGDGGPPGGRCEASLFDVTEGGTGVCEALFERLADFVAAARALGAPGACTACNAAAGGCDALGCPCCVFVVPRGGPAPCDNKGVAKALGASALGLRVAEGPPPPPPSHAAAAAERGGGAGPAADATSESAAAVSEGVEGASCFFDDDDDDFELLSQIDEQLRNEGI